MKQYLCLLLFGTFVFISCERDVAGEKERWKKEIVETEKEFASMAQSAGIPAAFVAFAAEDVAVLRGKELIKGKAALKASYEVRSQSGDISLTWKPDFVDVSASGDLGYTYGKYVFTSTDSLGNKRSEEGIFHTVWKRQADGKWKFVWD